MIMSQRFENTKSRLGWKWNVGLSSVTGCERIPVATGRNCSAASASPRNKAKLPTTVTTRSHRSLCLPMSSQHSYFLKFRAAISGSRERRLALFHEGGAALGVILAGEALLDQLRAAREVALALVAHGLVDDEFFGRHRKRRVASDGLGV